MSYYQRRYTRGRYRSGISDIGLERALQHIREGEELSRELGGTDEDVKEYFFSLSGVKLTLILDTYEKKYGKAARDYAQRTIFKWRSGERKMSGTVASRLFKLLPPFMPTKTKHNLVKNLWEQYSPQSNKVFRFGTEIDETELFDQARTYLIDNIVNYKMPEPLGNRFKWLTSNDVGVQQELLNHFLNLDKALVVKSLKAKLPVILDHMKNDGEFTQKISEKFKIGNHKLEFLLDPKAKGINLEDPSGFRFSGSSKPDRNYFAWIVAIVIILWVIYSWFH